MNARPAIQAGIDLPDRKKSRLERTDRHPLQRLLVGDKEIWARPKPPGTWEFARFGATRSDDEHGARLLVDDVRYVALFGGDGDDRIDARRGGFDVVGCGPGTDRVVADRRDLVGVDCERVARR